MNKKKNIVEGSKEWNEKYHKMLVAYRGFTLNMEEMKHHKKLMKDKFFKTVYSPKDFEKAEGVIISQINLFLKIFVELSNELDCLVPYDMQKMYDENIKSKKGKKK